MKPNLRYVSITHIQGRGVCFFPYSKGLREKIENVLGKETRFGQGVHIINRRKGPFPDLEVSRSSQMIPLGDPEEYAQDLKERARVIGQRSDIAGTEKEMGVISDRAQIVGVRKPLSEVFSIMPGDGEVDKLWRIS